MIKQKLVYYADKSIIGVFSRFIQKSTEKNYVYLEYYLLNSFPPKKKVLDTGIHTDHIHTIHSPLKLSGVEEEMIVIFTNEPGSVISNILKSDSEQTIKELREKIRKLQMQVASSKQNEEDARSGVNKVISSMKSVQRPQSNPSFDSIPHRFPEPRSGGFDGGNFEEF